MDNGPGTIRDPKGGHCALRAPQPRCLTVVDTPRTRLLPYQSAIQESASGYCMAPHWTYSHQCSPWQASRRRCTRIFCGGRLPYAIRLDPHGSLRRWTTSAAAGRRPAAHAWRPLAVRWFAAARTHVCSSLLNSLILLAVVRNYSVIGRRSSRQPSVVLRPGHARPGTMKSICAGMNRLHESRMDCAAGIHEIKQPVQLTALLDTVAGPPRTQLIHAFEAGDPFSWPLAATRQTSRDRNLRGTGSLSYRRGPRRLND